MMINVALTAVLTLLAERTPGTTICPSDVARKIFASGAVHEGATWRDLMPLVHSAVDQLVDQKKISLSWKGKTLSSRFGPYRIAQ